MRIGWDCTPVFTCNKCKCHFNHYDLMDELECICEECFEESSQL